MFKKIASIVTMVFLITLLPNCFNKEQAGLKLVNVNDAESFNDARIAGSVNLAFDKIALDTKNWDKKSEVIVYCTNYYCTESDRVAKVLKSNGFELVQIYRGGIQEWYQLSLEDASLYPFEGQAKQSFLHKPLVKTEDEKSEISVINSLELSKKLANEKK